MISFKSGVDVRGLHPLMWDAIYCIEKLYQEVNVGLVITSGVDGNHSNKSKHYSGMALDIRTRTLDDQRGMYARIKRVLPDAFDVVLHSTHIHIELDIKNQTERLQLQEWQWNSE